MSVGAIAAGHPLTAEVGANVLADGGNAVDACVAAGFASWVTESPLTGPGAGGFMLIHRGLDGRAAREMEEVDVDFDRETSQVFHIGAASCGVPGTVAGLEAAHRSFGSLPWRRLIEPAVRL